MLLVLEIVADFSERVLRSADRLNTNMVLNRLTAVSFGEMLAETMKAAVSRAAQFTPEIEYIVWRMIAENVSATGSCGNRIAIPTQSTVRLR